MKFYITTALILSSLVLAGPLSAQDTPSSEQSCVSRANMTLTSGEFVKKRYSIDGQWSVSRDCTEQRISFQDDFKTKSGPDLKVYLSKLSLEELNGGAVESNSLKIGVLKSNKGEQTYVLPADVTLSEYKSVVIHCEAYSVLWGGFDL